MTAPVNQSRFQADDLIHLFNSLFLQTENTRLVAGGDEPIYLPASSDTYFHQIIFTRDYFASALHEVAHWCLAGTDRRKLVDYGYWYEPDGRNENKQKEFEKVEVKPQSLEWVFHESCGHKFIISIDNLASDNIDPVSFKKAVLQQKQHYQQNAMPERANLFNNALSVFYREQQR